MTHGAARVLRRCLGRIGALDLTKRSERILVAALSAAAPGPSSMLLSAGLEAGLEGEEVLDRTSLAFINFTAFNLSDDLSDDECTYLTSADAAVALLLLSHMFGRGLLLLDLEQASRDAILRDLIAAEDCQVEEIATDSWDSASLRRVTDGIAGRQWAAYLRILWSGTELEAAAAEVATSLGRVGMLAGDISSNDPRYCTLSRDEKRMFLEDALREAEELESSGLEFFAGALAASRDTLLTELNTC